MYESLVKHVRPAFKIKQENKEINILDICYGLGFNSLATLLHVQQNNLDVKVNIHSPELDERLVKSLTSFTYPKEFEGFRRIIESIAKDGIYEDENIYIEVFLGDAREYVKRFENKFDIVYQDAFSPNANPALWTKEYFADVRRSMKENGVLTTYSISLATRLALYENGFNVYLNVGENYRDATVASPSKLDDFKEVDVPHKLFCNPNAKSLRD